MHLALVIAAAVLGLAAAAFAVGALLPAAWTVERSVSVQAPPAAVYPLVAGFRAGWSRWNPWAEPGMTIVYSGPDEGVGATQTWTGGDTNGGTITITKADPRQGVEFALTFGPFPIDGRIAFTTNGDHTTVTWTDTGTIAGLPIYRFMRFMLERFVGRPMARGLATLKQIAETPAAHPRRG